MGNQQEKGTRISSWVTNHGEWASLMFAIISCFLFCFNKSEKTNDRLDAHIASINDRIDASNERLDNHMTAINARTDELHKEFYELLKEMRSERNK